MAKAKKKIHYLISYDLDAKKGEKRDYESLSSALKGMGAKPILKSQWVYECEVGATAKDVSIRLLANLETEAMLKDILSGSAKKAPPIFDPDRDKLLVSLFPRGCGVIDYLAKGDHKSL